MFAELFTGFFIFSNFEALIIGALLSFLLTFLRTRLTWIDWTIVLFLNLPAALFPTTVLTCLGGGGCDKFSLGLAFGGTAFGIGLPLGLLCSRWVIAARPDPEQAN
jgi:hypothetical protein